MAHVTTRRLAAPALLAAAALIGAGCGSGGSSGAVSTATPSAAGAPAKKSLTKRQKGVKFAECLRRNGVPDFPDPDTKGSYAYGVSVSREVFTKAVSACKELEPPGALSSKRSPKEQSASLRFAACVRKNGVKDFPDPVQGEPLIDTYKIPSSNKPGGMTILNAATARCKSVIDQAMGGQ